jgi:hypothetical protein
LPFTLKIINAGAKYRVADPKESAFKLSVELAFPQPQKFEDRHDGITESAGLRNTEMIRHPLIDIKHGFMITGHAFRKLLLWEQTTENYEI